MNAKSSGSPASWVDPDDAPELTNKFLQRADLYEGERLVRRGRPPAQTKRPTLNMRIDADVLAHLRGLGKGWQTRVNALLREAVSHKVI